MSVDLSKVGSILRATREEKGIGVEEVSNILCLRKSLIEAIERGKWDALPHEIYVRSYIKEYANFLNISDQVLPELIERKNEIEPDVDDVVDQTPIKKRACEKISKDLFYPSSSQGICVFGNRSNPYRFFCYRQN
jgi:cytoskeletal protein RodZ